MSKFNQAATVSSTKTTNLAGGEAFLQTPELELVSILLTSFAEDKFYRSETQTVSRLRALIFQCDPKFVAQAAVYARTQFGMRSITHVVASELGKLISGRPWAKSFYKAIVHRPDDMTEILAYHTSRKEKISGAMKKGFAEAFTKFDAYHLAKYKGEGKDFKLVDVVNLVHPKPSTEAMATTLNSLMKGELKSFDTWEVELSRAGQEGKTEAEKARLKANVWHRLISERKIGYFALLRNLRNIIEQAPDALMTAITLLRDESMIRKSLVLPFRFTTAFEEIKKLPASLPVRNTMVALNNALDIAVNNVPKFEGETLVVLDVSGSMDGKPAQIGSLFAAVLIKACNADFMKFDDSARYVNVNPMDSTITIAESIRFASGGTNFKAIFTTANKKYARVIILSDMQGWIGYHAPTEQFNQYKKRHGANPKVYSFDLAGLGTLQMPERNVYCLAGFSEKVFDLMKFIETDKNILLNTIKAVSF